MTSSNKKMCIYTELDTRQTMYPINTVHWSDGTFGVTSQIGTALPKHGDTKEEWERRVAPTLKG